MSDFTCLPRTCLPRNGRLLACAALLLAGGLLTGCRSVAAPSIEGAVPSPAPVAAIEQAEREQDQGRYAAALARLRSAGAASAADREALRLAEVSLQSGWGKSLEDAQPALALPHFEAARALAELGQDDGAPVVGYLEAIADCERKMGRHAQAIATDRQALAQYDALGDPGLGAYALVGIGLSDIALKRPAEALPLLRRSLAFSQGAGDIKGTAAATSATGDAYAALRQPAQALGFYRKALPLWQSLGDRAKAAQARAGIHAAQRRLQGH